ncbi:MAG: CvpA family protein [Planctomycetota bacterium]|nr:CvpA family protein [Planctomycetota bacterium]
MTSHSIVDLVVLGIILYCAVRGATRGLLSQLSWVVALLLCFKFSGTLAPAIEPMIGVDPPLKQWLAMLAVYVGLCGLSFVAAGMLSSWMAKAKIIDFDKHLGGILGFFKGVIICMTVMFFAITMSPPMRQIVGQTYSGYGAALILHNSKYLIPLLPENAIPTVQNVIDNFNRSLQSGPDDLNGATPIEAGTFGNDAGLAASPVGGGSGFDFSKLFPDGLRGGSSGSGSPAGATGSSDSPATGNPPTLQDLLSRVPADLRSRLNQSMVDALQDSSADDKQQLLNQLGGSVPQDAGAILTDFFRRSPTAGGQGGNASSPSTQLGRNEVSLLNEIAGIYSQRNDIITKSKQYLAGVPNDVQRRVLEDWHADAMGLNSDPDPGTDVNTRIDDRILRQLKLARISVDDLDRELRTRLSLAKP